MSKKRRLATTALVGVLFGEIIFLLLRSPGEDFWQHYIAGRALLAGVPVNEALRAMFGRLGYPYPMFTVALVLPLSFLPQSWAFIAWVCLSYLAVVASAYMFAKRVVGLDPWAASTRALAGLVWPITFSTVFMGQITPLILVFMSVAYILGTRGKRTLAGMLLSLALIKPHFVAPIVGGLILRKQWRLVGGFALGAVVLIAASLSLGQGTSLDAWRGYVLGWCLKGRSVMMPGQLGLLPVPWRLLLSAIGYCGLGLWWLKRDTVRLRDTAFAFLASVLLSPYLPGYDLVLLVPVLVYMVDKGRAFFWLGMALSSAAPLLSGVEGAVTLAMLCFVLELLRLRRTRPPSRSVGCAA